MGGRICDWQSDLKSQEPRFYTSLCHLQTEILTKLLEFSVPLEKKSDINSSYLVWIINKSSSAVFLEECLPLSNSQEALAVNINADLPAAFLWPACSTTEQLDLVLQHHANNPTGTWDVLKTDNPLATWFSFLTSATYLACPHLSPSSLPLLFIASKHI